MADRDYSPELMSSIQNGIKRTADTVYGEEESEQKTGFMDLLWETSLQESFAGVLAPENINQLTEVFINDLGRLEEKIRTNTEIDPKEFHIEMTEEGQPDISEPYTNFAMTAISYIAKTRGFEGIDLTVPGERVATWKGVHNTMLGAGTEEQYLEKATKGPQVMWGMGMQ